MNNKMIKENFEIKAINEESIVYQRVIETQGKKAKDIKEKLSKMPTATLHTYTQEEFIHLKNIELELLNEIKVERPSENVFKKAFISFFELK